MTDEIYPEILNALSLALDLPVRMSVELPRSVQLAARSAGRDEADIAEFELECRRYVAGYCYRQRGGTLIAGPFRLVDDPPCDPALPVLDESRQARVRDAIGSAVAGLRAANEDRRARLEIASQFEVVNSSLLAVTGDLTLDTVLRRIVDLSRELAGARYAALGVPDANGELVEFITSGMDAQTEARIGRYPRGRGILGLLLREPKTIRLADLGAHPASSGFPPNHPPMKSFLGVPITARGRVLGNLYLTEKRFGSEFTEADARMVELLARHAAVAIENARLYSALELRERSLQVIVDQFPEAILLVEADPPTVTIANRQVSELLGWRVETPLPFAEWLRQNPRYHVDGQPITDEDVPINRALLYGEVLTRYEVRIGRPDGSLVTVLLNAAPIRDAHGRITAGLAVFQDISQIKDAEQLKDDFLSLVSHELRTPLTSIQGGGMLLYRDWNRLDHETRMALIGDIASESQRLADLIENMVQLSHIRAGRLQLATEPVLLRRLVERAVTGESEWAPDREFRTSVEPGLAADADPRSIDQILRNLLHNAVKYSPAGSPIDITVRREGDEVLISVRDYGPGIDEADLPHLFDRFRRSARAQSSSTPGMGLGLYLARHLVQAHGGRIWVERPADGGSRFNFTTPAVDEDD